MKSSEARFLFEKHLEDFFTLFPDDIPHDLQEHASPIFAMGMRGGLTVVSAAKYVYWLVNTERITDSEGGGLLAIVGNTARVVCQTDNLTWEAAGVDWKQFEQEFKEKNQPVLAQFSLAGS